MRHLHPCHGWSLELLISSSWGSFPSTSGAIILESQEGLLLDWYSERLLNSSAILIISYLSDSDFREVKFNSHGRISAIFRPSPFSLQSFFRLWTRFLQHFYFELEASSSTSPHGCHLKWLIGIWYSLANLYSWRQ